jgi:hypothetical protein
MCSDCVGGITWPKEFQSIAQWPGRTHSGKYALESAAAMSWTMSPPWADA